MVIDGDSVVITGSTRGIGLVLAREFLHRGHAVMISGRSQDCCDNVAEGLRAGGRFILSLVRKRPVIEEAMSRLDNPKKRSIRDDD